jgi:NAD(P)-dependent dehydrogenase (short-subunit alcohol dehydrogenase family)
MTQIFLHRQNMYGTMLEGKTALITGASRGIGKGIAVTFAQYGAFVGINYHSHDTAAKETLQLVRKNGGDGMLLKGDVSDAARVETIVETLVKKRGHIDV